MSSRNFNGFDWSILVLFLFAYQFGPHLAQLMLRVLQELLLVESWQGNFFFFLLFCFLQVKLSLSFLKQSKDIVWHAVVSEESPSVYTVARPN